MSLIAPAPESTALPESFSEQTSTTSETMATTMKARPMGIVLHQPSAYGFQAGLEVAGCTDPWDFASTDITGERGRESLEAAAAKRQHGDQRGVNRR
jgi:hypothetical protein